MMIELKQEKEKNRNPSRKMKSVKDTREIINKTLLEQQQFLGKLRRENSASNVIITGIANTIVINDAPTDKTEAKLEHYVCC